MPYATMRRMNLEIAVLSPEEKLLGHLNPELVQIEETNELYGMRSIKVVYPMDDRVEREYDSITKSWQYRVKYTLMGGSSAVTDATVYLQVFEHEGMTSPYSVNWLDSDGTTQLKWELYDNTTGWYCYAVKLDTPGVEEYKDIYLTWGEYTDGTLGYSTTEVYTTRDEFDDNSINSTLWETVSGGGTSSVAETGGYLTVTSDGTNRAWLKSKTSYSNPYIIEFKAKKSENYAVAFNWTGTVSGTYDYPYNGYLFEYRSWDATKNIEVSKYVNGTKTSLGSYNVTEDTNWHYFRIKIGTSGGVTKIRVNRWSSSTEMGSYALTDYISVTDSTFTSGYVGFSARETPAALNAYYSRFRAYNYIKSIPVYTTSPVEVNPNTIDYSELNPYQRLIPVGHSSSIDTNDYSTLEVTVPYMAGMRVGFTDVGFKDYETDEILWTQLLHKTNGVSATFGVYTGDYPCKDYVKLFWGDGTQTQNAYTYSAYQDSFEDSNFSSNPTWTLIAGTAGITSTSPICGTYSLTHQGDGTGSHAQGMYMSHSNSGTMNRFSFMFKTQGSLTNTPYAVLWLARYVDANNWLRLDTYWDSATSKQKLRWIKMESSVSTTLYSYDWKTSKCPINELHDFNLIDTGTYVIVYVDGVKVIDGSYSSTVSTGKCGVACLLDSKGMWDSIGIDYIYSKYCYLTAGELIEDVYPVNTNYLSPTTLLHHGNKLWRYITQDGRSCLYVMLEDKVIDPEANTITIHAEEVFTELSMLPPVRINTSTSGITLTTGVLDTYLGDLYTTYSVAPPNTTFAYNGTIGIMALVREMEKQSGGVMYRYYDYDHDVGVGTITRDCYLWPIGSDGSVHYIELGVNTKNITIEIDEADVAIASAPTGQPKDSDKASVDTFHQVRKAWEDFVVNAGDYIPLWVTKDESGNTAYGPYAYAPYSKGHGDTHVSSLGVDSPASYKTVNKKEGDPNTIPRTVLFESSEENPYNLYWLCVGKINDKKYQIVNIETEVSALVPTLEDYEPFNVGDIVYVKIPGYTDVVEGVITKTVKDPRNPDKDKITIGNYKINFFDDYLQTGSNRGLPYQRTD